MGTYVGDDSALVYANVGVHAEVEIMLAMDRDGGPGAAIHFGRGGPDVVMDFADVDSLQRLAAVAADGARQLRDRIDAARAANSATPEANSATPGANSAT